MVSAGELLEAAQEQAWELARERSGMTPRRSDSTRGAIAAWPVLRAHLQAWPEVAAAASSALTTLSRARGETSDLGGLHRVLERVRATSSNPQRVGIQESRHDVAPHVRLVRIAELLNGTSDLVATAATPLPDVTGKGIAQVIAALETPIRDLDSNEHEDLSRLQSKVVAVLETAARHTRIYVDHVGGGAVGVTKRRALFDDLVAEAHGALRHPPGQRDGRFDDIAVPEPGSSSLAAAIHRWGRSAEEALSDPRCRSATATTVAADAALLLGGARVVFHAVSVHELVTRQSSGNAIPALEVAHQEWAGAARSWSPPVLRPGLKDLDFEAASRQLVDRLRAELRPEGRWVVPAPADLPRLASLARQAVATMERVGLVYRQATDEWTGRSQLLIPARTLERVDLEDQVSLASAAVAGRWVPLPAQSRLATSIRDTARRADEATRAARTAAQPAAQSAPQTATGALLHPFDEVSRTTASGRGEPGQARRDAGQER